MNNIYLYGDISKDSVLNFINDFNRLDPQKQITVYLNSEGGGLVEMYMIKDILERCNKPIELVAMGNVMSAAFDLFFEVNVSKKRIISPTIGMTHQAECTVKIKADGKLHDCFYETLNHVVSLDNKKHFKMLKQLGLTEAELKLYNNGEDIYFPTERLNQFLKNAKIKNR